MSTWPHRPKGDQCSAFLSGSLEKESKSAFLSSPDSMQPLYPLQPSQIQPILRSLLKFSPWVYLCVSLWIVCRALKKFCIKEIFMASIFSSVFFCSFSFLFSLSLPSSLSTVLDSSLFCNQGYFTAQTQPSTYYSCLSVFEIAILLPQLPGISNI